jgi:chromate transporter
MKPAAILSLISFFSVLSILSIGGSNSVVPEMARHAVEVEHWLTAAQFTDIFAISQAAPGPNLIVALIGFKVAGFWGGWPLREALGTSPWSMGLRRLPLASSSPAVGPLPKGPAFHRSAT